MTTPSINEAIPELDVLITGGKTAKLSDFQGKNLVLYFYPRANTPGCTTESNDFTAAIKQFEALNCAVLGASRDGIKAQENFKAKYDFAFDLVSDKEEILCKAFDVIKLKKLYGKESLGIERSTFLIDAKGVLRQEWRKVKVKGHVEEVLAAVEALNN